MLVSHRYKFIYIKIQKVAGTSVESFFGQFCCDPEQPYTFEHASDETVNEFGIIGARMGGKEHNWLPHKPARGIYEDLGKNIFKSYFKFCVIRNPWDIVVSFYCWHYRDKKQTKEGFTKFVGQFENRDWKIHTIDDAPICDFYIRYETLEDDIRHVCSTLGITEYNLNDLPTFKKGSRRLDKHYSEYYTDETRDIVSKKFQKEIQFFGYSFEEPKPKPNSLIIT